MLRHRTECIAFEGVDPNLKVLDEEADAKRWEDLNKRGELLTKETYESWKEELHNLLLFAGLFSAIVTTFTSEAGKNVQGDPANMAVLLLQTIVLQLNNQTNPHSNLPIDLNPTATPSLNDQRINVLYSLSLTLSLVTVVGGIVCLQWLREFGRNIRGISNKEDLLLQYQRHESLRVWGVLFILNMLPLLLLISLGLFFTGFMFSQWESNTLASRPVTALVAILGTVITCTTVLPSFQLIWLTRTSNHVDGQLQDPPALCAYRSPQSWLFHLLLREVFYIVHILSDASYNWPESSLYDIRNWMDYDAIGVEKWKEGAGAVKSIHGALSWISSEYKQTTMVALDAYYCMIFASCLGSWKSLKGLSTLEDKFNIGWEWEERELLRSFERKNKFDNDEVVRKVCAKVVIDATTEWHKSDVLSQHVQVPLSDISALEESISTMAVESQKALLQDISTGLTTSGTAWTAENAVAVVCHLIDQDALRKNWVGIVPMLKELFRQPDAQSLCHIHHLCEKLRERMSTKHQCGSLLNIFNNLFPSVDPAHWPNLAPILSRLLVKCDQCSIHWGLLFRILLTVPPSDKWPFILESSKNFLNLIQDLTSKCLGERSLDGIFMYTPYIIQHSWGSPEALGVVGCTLNTIILAAEDHVKQVGRLSTVLHPDYMPIPRLLLPVSSSSDDDLGPVWIIIDDYNKRLAHIWTKPRDVDAGSKTENARRRRRLYLQP